MSVAAAIGSGNRRQFSFSTRRRCLSTKVVVEGEPLLAAVHDLAAALPLHVQRADEARRRRALDLQGVEVLLQTAHVVEADLARGESPRGRAGRRFRTPRRPEATRCPPKGTISYATCGVRTLAVRSRISKNLKKAPGAGRRACANFRPAELGNLCARFSCLTGGVLLELRDAAPRSISESFGYITTNSDWILAYLFKFPEGIACSSIGFAIETQLPRVNVPHRARSI